MASGSQQVIIDDQNTDFLTFTGPWSQQGDFLEFNETTSVPTAPGANVTLQFNGTGVAVYGTYGQGGNSTTLLFSIDNGTPENVTYAVQNNQETWAHSNLFAANVSDGSHTLTTSIIAIGGLEQGINANVFIDYFIVTQSAGTPVGQGAMSFFDDTDPAFQYSGSWSPAGGTRENMGSTIYGALEMNSSASLRFTGTFVNIYGSVPISSSVDAIAQFVVDDGPPFVALYPPVEDVSFGQFHTSPNLRLYHNSSLSPGAHVMVINPLAKEALWIDYAISGNGVDTMNVGNAAVDHLSTSGTLSLPSATSSASGGHSNVSGNIAGGVVGSLAGLAVLALLIIFYMRHKRTRAKDMEELHQRPGHLSLADSLLPSDDAQLVTPFDFKYDRVAPSSSGNPGSAGADLDNWKGKGVASPSGTQSEPVPASAITTSYPSPTIITTPVTGSSMIPTPTLQHHDSGIRGLVVPETVVEVPPMYSED